MTQRLVLLLLGIPLVIIGAFIFFSRERPKSETPEEVPPNGKPTASIPMKIESPVFGHNQNIPPQYTCEGSNSSPPLRFADIPAEAKSLVLIMDDPDAPRGILRPGSGQAWVHWTIWNISPETKEIAESSVPAGAVEGITSFGRPGYGGPCPPSGTHRYFFKLYALDIAINLPATADKVKLEAAMAGHILAQAEMVGLYQR